MHNQNFLRKCRFLFQIVLLLQVEMVPTRTLRDATSVSLRTQSPHTINLLHLSPVLRPDSVPVSELVLVLTFLQGSSR